MADRRAVRDHKRFAECFQSLAVPAVETAGRLLLVVVHRAEEQVAVRSDVTVVDAVARLVGLRLHERLATAARQVETSEPGLEARDHHVRVLSQGDEADPLRDGQARGRAGPRLETPDGFALDVDPEQRAGALIPHRALAKHAAGGDRDTRGFGVNSRAGHANSLKLQV